MEKDNFSVKVEYKGEPHNCYLIWVECKDSKMIESTRLDEPWLFKEAAVKNTIEKLKDRIRFLKQVNTEVYVQGEGK